MKRKEELPPRVGRRERLAGTPHVPETQQVLGPGLEARLWGTSVTCVELGHEGGGCFA